MFTTPFNLCLQPSAIGDNRTDKVEDCDCVHCLDAHIRVARERRAVVVKETTDNARADRAMAEDLKRSGSA